MNNYNLPAPTETERLNYKKTTKLVYAKTSKIGKPSSPRLVIDIDFLINGKKDIYTILSKEKIGSGGESQVFFSVSQKGSDKYVAKIYDNMEDNPAQNELREIFCTFLSQENDFKTNHLMPLLDYGETSIINNGRVYRRHVDILPFCKDGNFDNGEKISFEKLRCEIIPQLATALNTLHKNGFVHRDVKPANIFTLENTIVLGDFGTVSLIDDGDDFTLTRKNRGTLGYTAPEVIGGSYAVPESDWYSFGCTIATLYLGKHPYEEILRSKDRAAFLRSMNTKGLFMNCPVEEQCLQVLVDSLTRTNEKERAGYEEIKKWCENPTAFAQKSYKKEASSASSFHFVFEKTECDSPEKLVNAMLCNWEKAIKYLYRGGAKNSVVVQGFAKFNQSVAIKAGDIIENEETARNYNLGLARFLHFIAKNGKIHWKGKMYNNIIEVAQRIGSDPDTDNDLIELLQSKYLSWIISDKDYYSAEEALIKYLDYIEDFAAIHPATGLYFFKYAVLNKETFSGMASFDEIFDFHFKSSRDFEEAGAELIQNEKLLGFLAARGNYSGIKKFLDSSKDNDIVYKLTYIYSIFEKCCSDKEKVRKHYCSYGPKAYLFWIRNNLDVYCFKGELGDEIKSVILSGNAEKEMTIGQLESEANKIYEGVNDLKTYFYGNPLMAYFCLEYSEASKCVRPNNLSAYFVDKYFGFEIPYGFKMSLDGGKIDG